MCTSSCHIKQLNNCFCILGNICPCFIFALIVSGQSLTNRFKTIFIIMCQLEIIVSISNYRKFKTGQNGCKYSRAKRKKNNWANINLYTLLILSEYYKYENWRKIVYNFYKINIKSSLFFFRISTSIKISMSYFSMKPEYILMVNAAQSAWNNPGATPTEIYIWWEFQRSRDEEI